MLSFLAATAVLQAAPAGITPFEPQGFRTQIVVEIAVPRETVFDTATGDVSPWWDHTFYPEPHALVIEPRAGGRFYEQFIEGERDGVIHADIISVYRPELLRMDGPLGLSGRAFQMVTTWTLNETEDGAGTVFTIDLAMAGEIDAETAAIVRQVWVHFIEGRLKPYMEAGCHDAPDEPCAAFAAAD